MKIKQIEVNKLKPYEKNTLIHSEEQVTQVSESIKAFGFKVPIIVDKDFIIISGHCRYEAAQSLKLKKVPCIVAEDLTEDQVKAFRIADNRVREKAVWDIDLVELELKSIKENLNLEFLEFKFEPVDLGENITEEEQKDEPLEKEPKQFRMIVTCFDEVRLEELCKKLKGDGYNCALDN